MVSSLLWKRAMKAWIALFALTGCVAAGSPGDGVDAGLEPGSGSGSGSGSGADATSVSLAMPARLQWEANFGYCGELSMAGAGLYFGQYVSQYDARALASPGVKQSEDASQLLLDANEGTAATAMKLRYEIWPKTGDPTAFLLWLKNHVVASHPVVLGVFENTQIFDFTAEAGDDYDHIVPVMGYASSHPLSDQQVYADDQVTFSDNGDYDQTVATAPLMFTYAASGFVYDRAHQPDQPYYIDDGEDSAIAILGVADDRGETLPVRVQPDQVAEEPEMVDGSSTRPAPGPVTLSITVSGLAPDTDYVLYKYTSFAKVPTSDFTAHAADAAATTAIRISSGSTFTTQDSILSSEMRSTAR